MPIQKKIRVQAIAVFFAVLLALAYFASRYLQPTKGRILIGRDHLWSEAISEPRLQMANWIRFEGLHLGSKHLSLLEQNKNIKEVRMRWATISQALNIPISVSDLSISGIAKRNENAVLYVSASRVSVANQSDLSILRIRAPSGRLSRLSLLNSDLSDFLPFVEIMTISSLQIHRCDIADRFIDSLVQCEIYSIALDCDCVTLRQLQRLEDVEALSKVYLHNVDAGQLQVIKQWQNEGRFAVIEVF
jgi:hypothetical protein